jgi:CubicO group peptidase (beta-lactamase class C family)
MNHKSILLLLKIYIASLLLFACTNKKKGDLADNYYDNGDTIAHISPSRTEFKKLPANFVASKSATIDHFFNKHWSLENSNISFLVAKDGQIIYEKYQGYANKNKGTSITSETSIHIASVSKVLTATAILELINAKKIDLNQKVTTILKQFPYPEITIKTLLNHRSGMRNYAYFTEDKGVWDRKIPFTNADLLRVLGEKQIKLESPTNKRFAYCNTNYAILALIIEKTTGLKYGAAMKRMIFDPLGMKDTYVFDYAKDRKTAVPSYKGNNLELAFDYLDAVYGDKNIYSTPRDLLKFDMARNAPTFLNPQLRNEVFQGYSNEHKGTKNYGLGIRMIDWETGQHFYFHNGWWHGNTSSYVTLKKENVTIIALSNKFNKMTYKVRDLAPLFGDYPFKLDKDELEE